VSTDQNIIDTEFEAITADAIAEARAAAIEQVVDFSGELPTHRSASEGAIAGYENTFQGFLDAVAGARAANVTIEDLASALKADEPKAEKGEPKPEPRHLYKSAGSLSSIEVVIALRAKDGEVPEGWVWRVDKDGTIRLLEGEDSIAALIFGVIKPSEASVAALKKHGTETGIPASSLYGKKLALDAVTNAENKDGAIKTLVAIRKSQKKIVEAIKKAEKEPADKTAETYIKAAGTQINKIIEMLDEGKVNDPAAAKIAIQSLIADLGVIAAHDALDVSV
jgi:hypothetical protein